MCVYACMCVCVCVCAQSCVFMYACMCVCMYVCMHVCVYTCCIYVCLHIVCVFMCECVYLCVLIKVHLQSSCQFCTCKKTQSPTLSLRSKHPFMNIFHEKFFTPNPPNLSPDTCQQLSWTMHPLPYTFKALIKSADVKRKTKFNTIPRE